MHQLTGPGDGNKDRETQSKISNFTKGEIKKLEEAGWGHGEKSLNSKKGGWNDLYKDTEGNVYEKRKGGSGPGEPTGWNLKKLSTGVGIIGVGTVIFKFLDRAVNRFTPVFMSTITMYQFNNSIYDKQSLDL